MALNDLSRVFEELIVSMSTQMHAHLRKTLNINSIKHIMSVTFLA